MSATPPLASCKVYTPDSLAHAIVEAVGDETNARWLEPSHGRGAFLRALSAAGVAPKRILALDLDATHSASDCLARVQRGVDFLQWSQTTRRRFDRIVGTPPYVAIRHLSPSLRRVAASLPSPDGHPIGTAGNLWNAFVVASLRLLRPGGSLAFVLPSASEYADYSARVREAARDRFGSLELYRCTRPLFEDVQEGTVVAIARDYGNGPCRFRRKLFHDRDTLIQGLRTLQPVTRRRCRPTCIKSSHTGPILGDVATIRLGGVTGDAKYFLMTEADRVMAELPREACTPVVTRSRHLQSAILDSLSWERLRASGERVWLFNPSDRVFGLPAVQRKLSLCEYEGGCHRSAFKVAIREPWYRTPLPATPHGFISGMQADGPCITMNEMPGLNATNTLYVVTFKDCLSLNERFGVALSLLTTGVRRQLRRVMRRYADGLTKYEPGALLRLQLPELCNVRGGRDLYRRVVSLRLQGGLNAARAAADESLGI